ncbi:hypothetical protein NL676_029434 [Syzygium grande]|nr:hypothetical protein NL676_029434 [Syzygium grande]
MSYLRQRPSTSNLSLVTTIDPTAAIAVFHCPVENLCGFRFGSLAPSESLTGSRCRSCTLDSSIFVSSIDLLIEGWSRLYVLFAITSKHQQSLVTTIDDPAAIAAFQRPVENFSVFVRIVGAFRAIDGPRRRPESQPRFLRSLLKP